MRYLGTILCLARAGSLAAKSSLLFWPWREEILAEEDGGERVKFLRWLNEGVRIEDFLRRHSEGRFRGVKYSSKYPTSREFENFVECRHVGWVMAEIQKLVKFKYGAVRKWADSGIEGEPCIIAPLQVEEERTKNRLIYNAQFLNCFMEPPS